MAQQQESEFTGAKVVLVLLMIASVVYLIVQLLYTSDCPAFQHAYYNGLGLQVGCRM